MQWSNPYVSNQTKMEMLQRWLIIHASIYYNYNSNVVTDKQWDANAYQLVDMMERYPKTYKKTFYYYIMDDFDGSTGFDLIGRLEDWNPKHAAYLDGIARNVMASASKYGKKVDNLKK